MCFSGGNTFIDTQGKNRSGGEIARNLFDPSRLGGWFGDSNKEQKKQADKEAKTFADAQARSEAAANAGYAPGIGQDEEYNKKIRAGKAATQQQGLLKGG